MFTERTKRAFTEHGERVRHVLLLPWSVITGFGILFGIECFSDAETYLSQAMSIIGIIVLFLFFCYTIVLSSR